MSLNGFRWSARRRAVCRAGRRSDGADCPAVPGRPAKVRDEPFEGSDVRSVDRGVVHVQQAGLLQFGEKDGVKAGPDVGFGPVLQSPPGRHPAAPSPLRRRILPAHALTRDIDGATQRGAVVRRQPPGVPPSTGRPGREQRGDALPQVIRHKTIRPRRSLPSAPPTAKPPIKLILKWSVRPRRLLLHRAPPETLHTARPANPALAVVTSRVSVLRVSRVPGHGGVDPVEASRGQVLPGDRPGVEGHLQTVEPMHPLGEAHPVLGTYVRVGRG
ncbi:hypothetical protein SUDANB126_07121 [Streptomyces sp. enrichment culture]